VPVYYDGACETAETFSLRLTNPLNAWLGEGHAVSLDATGTITPNAPPPTINVQDVRVVERTGPSTWLLDLSVVATGRALRRDAGVPRNTTGLGPLGGRLQRCERIGLVRPQPAP